MVGCQGIKTDTATRVWKGSYNNETVYHGGGQNHYFHDTDDGEHEIVYGVLLPWFVQATGLIVFYFLSRQSLSLLHHVPYTCVLFLVGVLMGAAASRDGLEDQLTDSVQLWRRMESEVLFAVFLPGLLFKDALELPFYLFQTSFVQLLIWAFPMVLVGTALTAVFVRTCLPYNDDAWSWALALTVGSILSATDPVAVAALLKEVGAPPRIQTHLAGESLLNDGSAMVFFAVFSKLFYQQESLRNNSNSNSSGDEVSWGDGWRLFCRMSLGGTVVGIVYALMLWTLLRYFQRRYDREEHVLQVAATVTVAYLAFYTAQITYNMSGVLAVVTCGILTKAWGGPFIGDWQMMNSFWSLLEHLLNTMIFALGGIKFGYLIGDHGEAWTRREWGYLMILYVGLNVIRLMLLFFVYPLTSKIGLGTTWQETLFSSWSGLRGAVGITLALGLDHTIRQQTDDEELWKISNRIFGMVGGIAFLTLVVNGCLSGPLLTALQLTKPVPSRTRLVRDCVQETARRRMVDDLLQLLMDPKYATIDFSIVLHHCPLLRHLTASEVLQAWKLHQHRHPPQPAALPEMNQNACRIPNLDPIFSHVANSQLLQSELERYSATQPPTLADAFGTAAEEEEEQARHDSYYSRKELLQQTRRLFVSLVRAAYTRQIREGALNPRHYEGLASFGLLRSLEVTEDLIDDGETLNDWALVKDYISAGRFSKTTDRKSLLMDLYSYVVIRFRSAGNVEHGNDGNSSATAQGKLAILATKTLPLDIICAIAFIDAHAEAQHSLQQEVCQTPAGSTSDLKAAFRIVLKESQRQVERATTMLDERNTKDGNRMVSHHLCVLLLSRAGRYTQSLIDSGVLQEHEAGHYLEQIEDSIQKVYSCNLHDHSDFSKPSSEDAPSQQNSLSGSPMPGADESNSSDLNRGGSPPATLDPAQSFASDYEDEGEVSFQYNGGGGRGKDGDEPVAWVSSVDPFVTGSSAIHNETNEPASREGNVDLLGLGTTTEETEDSDRNIWEATSNSNRDTASDDVEILDWNGNDDHEREVFLDESKENNRKREISVVPNVQKPSRSSSFEHTSFFCVAVGGFLLGFLAHFVVTSGTHASDSQCRGEARPLANAVELRRAVDDYLLNDAPYGWARKQFGQSIGTWDVSLVNCFSGVFDAEDRNPLAAFFNEDISNWSTSAVRDTSFMFNGCRAFNQPVGKWDVSNVVSMAGMFQMAESFNQNLNSWNVGAAVDMRWMFFRATSFQSNLDAWRPSSVQVMTSMFQDAIAFEGYGLSSWTVSEVLDMDWMFYNASSFNADLAMWETSKLLSIRAMFHEAISFNQDLSNWNVSSVTNMDVAFTNARSFQQNLCPWSTHLPSNVTLMGAFRGSSCPSADVPTNMITNPPSPLCFDCTAIP